MSVLPVEVTRTRWSRNSFLINSLLSKPLNQWTEIEPDRLEYDCRTSQGLEIQTNSRLSTHHNYHDQISGAAERLSFDYRGQMDVQFIMIITIFEGNLDFLLILATDVGFWK